VQRRSKSFAQLKDQTSKGRSLQLALCRPPLPTQRTNKGGPHKRMSFGFNTARGSVKCSALGECSHTHGRAPRVETANEGYAFIMRAQRNRESEFEGKEFLPAWADGFEGEVTC